MSAATALALDTSARRAFQRHPLNVPLDLIVLRSGIPETLPGRCTDICEGGVGSVLAGELLAGQQVGIELRLPNVGVPVRARALVIYQSYLRCGLQFVGLSTEQREMIRYWVYRCAAQSAGVKTLKNDSLLELVAPIESEVEPAAAHRPRRKIRIVRRGFYLLMVCMLALAGLGWWQWQKSWSELEKRTPRGNSGLRVSPETMDERILARAAPLYPEAARKAGTEGLVVLDAVIGSDGSVMRLAPLSGPSMLVQSATDAVRSWKFEPYLSSGAPVEVETTIAVDFRLN